jgi:hypothetical protein
MEHNINGVTCYTIEDTAEIMKTTIPRVLMLIKKGVLGGWMVDGEWYVTKETVCACPNQSVQHKAVSSCGSGGCSGCGS